MGAVCPVEKGPRDGKIACGVADGELAKVKDACQASFFDEEIACGEIAVDEDGGIFPRGCEGVLPECESSSGVDFAFENGEGAENLFAICFEGAAAIEAVWAGWGSSFWIDLMEGMDEVGEGFGKENGVGRGSACGGVSGEPGVDGKVPRIVGRGLAKCDGFGDGEWQMGGELGEPRGFFFGLAGVLGSTREANE